MRKFSTSDIKHLATLSGLSLTEEEQVSLGSDLEEIIQYVNKLDELDVSGVEPTYQVTDLINVSRSDEVREDMVGREQLLSLSPDETDGQIRVPKVL